MRPSPDPETKLLLPFTPPLDWPALLRYFAPRALPGVEAVGDGAYRRTLRLDGVAGTIEVSCPDPGARHLAVRLRLPGTADVAPIVARLRRVFDLDADPSAIAAALARDPVTAPLVAARPGLRLPGAWDPFELAVRTVLGQQVSVAGATTLARRLIAAHGEALPDEAAAPGLTHLFPTPQRLAGAHLSGMGLPGARAAAITRLAAAVASDPALLEPSGGLDAAVARLVALPGIGPWTAHYVAMRALREADAFPASDLALLRAAAGPGGIRPSPAALLARAEAWRPWRGYAAMHLWASDSASASAARAAAPSPVAPSPASARGATRPAAARPVRGRKPAGGRRAPA